MENFGIAMNRLSVFFILVFLISACNTIKNPFLGKRSAHEIYSESLSDAGLAKSLLGSAWMRAADEALASPQLVSIPYQETGFFAADEPTAMGYRFAVVRGQEIVVNLSDNPDSVLVFMELWRQGGKASLLAAIDTATMSLHYVVTRDDSLVLRLQPELLANLEYTLRIQIQPSLAFPVDQKGKPRLISFWGNPRDGGARSHEGVDIGAAFRTPALAAASGVVARVGDNRLGGKVVFLRAENTGDHLYYAHLDSQIAVTGQRVMVGDTLRLIGNTGNARNTPPHLHFGIYTTGGAINPLPFINPDVKKPAKITAPGSVVNHFLRSKTNTSLYAEASVKGRKIRRVMKDEPIKVVAATANWYKVKTMNDSIGFVESGVLTEKEKQELVVRQPKKLFLDPSGFSPVISSLQEGQRVSVVGVFSDFYLVNADGNQGWIPMSD